MPANTDEAVYGIQEKRTLWGVLTSEKYFKWTLLIPLLTVLLVFMLYPLFYCLFYSTQDATLVGETVFVGLDNYRTVLRDAAFWLSLRNTFQIMVMCLAGELGLGMGIALILNRKFRGQDIVRGLCLLPLLASPLAMSLTWNLLLHYDVGMVNQVLSAIWLPKINFFSLGMGRYTIALITIWQWFPFSVFVLLAGLKGLPRDAFEAAKVDGASAWFTFRRLTLPMLSPLIMIVVLLRTMWLIRLFDPIYGTLRQTREAETLDYFVFRIAFSYFDIGVGSTLAVISLFLTIIICAVLFRRLMLALEAAR